MMMPLPEAMIAILAPFAVLFTRPVWRHVQVLGVGALLRRGPRPVAAGGGGAAGAGAGRGTAV